MYFPVPFEKSALFLSSTASLPSICAHTPPGFMHFSSSDYRIKPANSRFEPTLLLFYFESFDSFVEWLDLLLFFLEMMLILFDFVAVLVHFLPAALRKMSCITWYLLIFIEIAYTKCWISSKTLSSICLLSYLDSSSCIDSTSRL